MLPRVPGTLISVNIHMDIFNTWDLGIRWDVRMFFSPPKFGYLGYQKYMYNIDDKYIYIY